MGSLSILHWIMLIAGAAVVYFIIAFITRSRRRRKLFAYAERGIYGETPPKKTVPNGGKQNPLQEPTADAGQKTPNS
jgi:hypothetical protein